MSMPQTQLNDTVAMSHAESWGILGACPLWVGRCGEPHGQRMYYGYSSTGTHLRPTISCNSSSSSSTSDSSVLPDAGDAWWIVEKPLASTCFCLSSTPPVFLQRDAIYAAEILSVRPSVRYICYISSDAAVLQNRGLTLQRRWYTRKPRLIRVVEMGCEKPRFSSL